MLLFDLYQPEKFGRFLFVCTNQHFKLAFKIQFRFYDIIMGIILISLFYFIYSITNLGLFNLTIKILCIKFIIRRSGHNEIQKPL